MELASTSRDTPAAYIRASSTAVAWSLLRVYPGASPGSIPCPTIAAWWYTASTPCSTRDSSLVSPTSPTTSPSHHAGVPPPCACGSRASSATTSCPAARSASTMCDPTNPAAPVTSTRMLSHATAAAAGQRPPVSTSQGSGGSAPSARFAALRRAVFPPRFARQSRRRRAAPARFLSALQRLPQVGGEHLRALQPDREAQRAGQDAGVQPLLRG